MKRWIPTSVLLLIASGMLLYGPIAQFDHYHEFADHRALLRLPNAADVLSNIGFAVVGLWGLWALRNQGKDERLDAARAGYCAFLAALILTAIGSAFYHLAPNNDHLLWDRLPIALACAGLLAAVHAETHDSQSRRVLPALTIAGVVSVLWWSITQSIGAGDLRPYLLMQGAPLVLIPLWHWLNESPRTDRLAFGVAILLYVLAKFFELNDRSVFETLGFISGHTIKHLLSVAAAAVIATHIVRSFRRAARPIPPHRICIPRGIRWKPDTIAQQKRID